MLIHLQISFSDKSTLICRNMDNKKWSDIYPGEEQYNDL